MRPIGDMHPLRPELAHGRAELRHRRPLPHIDEAKVRLRSDTPLPPVPPHLQCADRYGVSWQLTLARQ
jgi:hypothetical protein